jgi:hypothetical protein
MCLKGIESEDVDCIYLTQVRARWWAFLKTVMNIRVPEMAENFLII